MNVLKSEYGRKLLDKTQAKDKLQLLEIEKCGYTNYIIQDMGGFNPKFVNEQFTLFNDYINNLSITQVQPRGGVVV